MKTRLQSWEGKQRTDNSSKSRFWGPCFEHFSDSFGGPRRKYTVEDGFVQGQRCAHARKRVFCAYSAHIYILVVPGPCVIRAQFPCAYRNWPRWRRSRREHACTFSRFSPFNSRRGKFRARNKIAIKGCPRKFAVNGRFMHRIGGFAS